MRQWKFRMMAATLVCGTSLFIACSEESTDNPVAPIEPRQRVITFEGIENAREMGGHDWREPGEFRVDARHDRLGVWLPVAIYREPTRLHEGRAATAERQIPGELERKVAVGKRILIDIKQILQRFRKYWPEVDTYSIIIL